MRGCNHNSNKWLGFGRRKGVKLNQIVWNSIIPGVSWHRKKKKKMYTGPCTRYQILPFPCETSVHRAPLFGVVRGAWKVWHMGRLHKTWPTSVMCILYFLFSIANARFQKYNIKKTEGIIHCMPSISLLFTISLEKQTECQGLWWCFGWHRDRFVRNMTW